MKSQENFRWRHHESAEARHVAAELQEAQGQVDGVEGEVNGHRREKCAGADVEPGEGDAEKPERNERGGVDVDDCEEETGKEHGTPDGHDLRQTAEKHAAEEQFFKKGGFDEEKGEENHLAAQGKRTGSEELDKFLVGQVNVGEAGE